MWLHRVGDYRVRVCVRVSKKRDERASKEKK